MLPDVEKLSQMDTMGFLVSVKDVNGLVDKMRILIEDQETNRINGRTQFETC